MASLQAARPEQSVHPLLKLPLHVVASILSYVDSIPDLVPIILSHSIFRDAVKDNVSLVATRIIVKNIPYRDIVLTTSILDSSDMTEKDSAKVDKLLADLEEAPSDIDKAALASLNGRSLSEYAFIDQTYETAVWLAKAVARETIPIANEHLRLQRASPEITPREKSRLVRGFLRYALMCSALRLDRSSESTAVRFRFFKHCSPWVNEQLMCVYAYLERKATGALDELAAHDVTWGKTGIKAAPEAGRCPLAQWLVSQDLLFQKELIQAETYREKFLLVSYSLAGFEFRVPEHWPYTQFTFMKPKEAIMDDRGFTNHMTLLVSYIIPELEQFSQPLDGDDKVYSRSFITWLDAHLNGFILTSMFNDTERNLWDCGYVLWDHTDTSEDLRSAMESLKRQPSIFKRYRDTWTSEELERSQRQRSDIVAAGGHGYWPRDGIDFGQITGLSEDQQKELVEKWERE